jgi:hypothetical protein
MTPTRSDTAPLLSTKGRQENPLGADQATVAGAG